MTKWKHSAFPCIADAEKNRKNPRVRKRIAITCNRPNRLYCNGETAEYSICVYNGDQPAGDGILEVLISRDGGPGNTIRKTFDLRRGNPVQCSARMTEACFCLLQAWAGGNYASHTVWYRTPEVAEQLICLHQIAGSGSSVHPEPVTAADPERPADFDSFWKGVLEKASALPPDMRMEKMPEFSHARATYYRISMNTLNNERVYGYLGIPPGKGPFPVLALFPGAGPGWGTPVDCGYTAAGCLTVMLNVHKYPVPSRQSEAEKKMLAYAEQHHVTSYLKAGSACRETYHFYTILPGFCRVLSAITEMFPWDGKHCVMAGSSQGGWMALCMAALCRETVSAVYAGVPSVGLRSKMRREDDALKLDIPLYFDADFHAPAIRATAFIVAGMQDTSCPAQTVIAMFGLLGSRNKTLVVEPYSGHMVTPDRQEQERNFIMAQLGTGKGER